jgi:pimeloyl-ACP methyl ester carboxylesterase
MDRFKPGSRKGAGMISDQAGMRQLTTLDGGGILLHGTYHKPQSLAGNEAAVSTTTLGIMFTNALSSPRSLVGDSGVYWATSFASLGYPSFRFDFPGLGDSYGEIPNDLLRFTNQGGYAAVASSKARELVQKYQLSGVVMFCHCSGGTTAIYGASSCKECKGLVLLDPDLTLPRALTVTLQPGLVLWIRRSRAGAILRATYDRVRALKTILGKGDLPPGTNFDVINRFKEVVSRGTPILVLKAPETAISGGAGKADSLDYFEYIRSFAVRSDQISIRTIEDTDHSFSNHAGQLAVRQHTEKWLSENFAEGVASIAPVQQQESQIQAPLILR